MFVWLLAVFSSYYIVHCSVKYIWPHLKDNCQSGAKTDYVLWNRILVYFPIIVPTHPLFYLICNKLLVLLCTFCDELKMLRFLLIHEMGAKEKLFAIYNTVWIPVYKQNLTCNNQRLTSAFLRLANDSIFLVFCLSYANSLPTLIPSYYF